MTENFSEIINEETASQKLLQWSGEYERTCGHKPLALIHSYGCQQNVSDGEKIKGMLSKVGYEFTSDVNEAQLILYNTCAVRENAEDKVFGKLGDLKHLKENNPRAYYRYLRLYGSAEARCRENKKDLPSGGLGFRNFCIQQYVQYAVGDNIKA